MTGAQGFEKDAAEGVRLHDLAVEQGSKRAAHVLSVMYAGGLDVDEDADKAAHYAAIAEASTSAF
jgi:TPR repeat protein